MKVENCKMKILILANNDVGLYKFRKELIEELLQSGSIVAGKKTFCEITGSAVFKGRPADCKTYHIMLIYLGQILFFWYRRYTRLSERRYRKCFGQILHRRLYTE